MLALLLALAAPEPMLIVTGDRVYDAKVNGVPVRLRIDPATISMPVLNPDVVDRLKLKGTMVGVAARVGPIRIKGRTRVVKLDIGRGEFERRAAWFDQPFVPGADADPDEVVVTAESKTKREYRLEIGREDLKNCSSIAFDKPRKLVTLTCL